MSSRRPATNGTPGAGDGQRNSVVLGPNDRLVGQLYIEGDLRVAGTVEGALEATGDIEIGGGGRVSGPVTAYNKLVVGPDGSLNGDVRVSRLVVEDGATFSGNVQMGKAAAPARAPEPAPEPAPGPAGSAPSTPGPEIVPDAQPAAVAELPAPTQTARQKSKRR